MKPLLLIPLAGLGIRFTDEGFTTPKQLLEVDGDITCLEKTLLSIKNIHNFNLIAYVRDPLVADHLADILQKITIDYHIINGSQTKSPIDTVQKILDSGHSFVTDNTNVYVHTLDVDTPDNFSIDLKYPISTYIFKANSTNYSYVKILDGYVSQIVDQNRVSEHANVGIYGYGPAHKLREFCKKSLALSELVSAEITLVDIYKLYLAEKIKIKAIEIETVHIFGTPLEYNFCRDFVYPNANVKNCFLFSDHSGIPTKNKLNKSLVELGFNTTDLGPFNNENDTDYPDYAFLAHEAKVKNGGYIFGSCSTGQGVCISLNKMPGILSALIYDRNSFKMAIMHNCANAFCFPNSIWENQPLESVMNELKTAHFTGGRHQNRLIKLLDYRGG